MPTKDFLPSNNGELLSWGLVVLRQNLGLAAVRGLGGQPGNPVRLISERVLG